MSLVSSSHAGARRAPPRRASPVPGAGDGGRVVRPLLAAALLALPLAGCGLVFRSPVHTRTVELRAAPRANDDTPVRVQLVVVRDDELAKTVGTLSAARWFATRDQMRADFPATLETAQWELVPGQTVRIGRLPFRRRGARALFVFADYLAPGDHRARADPWTRATVELGERDFTVQDGRRR